MRLAEAGHAAAVETLRAFQSLIHLPDPSPVSEDGRGSAQGAALARWLSGAETAGNLPVPDVDVVVPAEPPVPLGLLATVSTLSTEPHAAAAIPVTPASGREPDALKPSTVRASPRGA